LDGAVGEGAFRWLSGVAGVLILASLVPLDFLTGRRLVTFQGAALVTCSVFAVALAAVAIVRSHGAERRWRLLLSSGLVSSLVGVIYWSVSWSSVYHCSLAMTPADAAYFLPPLIALAGLLAIPVEADTTAAGQRAPPLEPRPVVGAVVVALDGLLIVVSLLLVSWVAVLEHVTRSGVSGWQLALALGYPITGVGLVVVALLVATFRQPRNIRAMGLVTVSLLGFAVSESAVVYLAVRGPFGVEDTVVYWIGTAVAPPVLALAMLVPRRRPTRDRRARPERNEDRPLWAHAYLPYLALGVAAVLVVVPAVRGDSVQGLTLQLSVMLTLLVVIRQMITVAQNTRLLVKLRAAQRRLRYQALHDPLTGLANRALFTAEVDHAVAAHRASGRPLVALFCDLDGFKAINDTLGHAAGDELLRTVGQRLRDAVREADLVARLGGDEFAVLLEDPTGDPRETGDSAAKRIQEAMSPAFDVHGQRRQVRVSVGVAVADTAAPVDGTEELLHRADQAMYVAKRRKRRRSPRALRRRVSHSTDG
jgi:diguanylate cyclase (GGDEF)-like protein